MKQTLDRTGMKQTLGLAQKQTLGWTGLWSRTWERLWNRFGTGLG